MGNCINKSDSIRTSVSKSINDSLIENQHDKNSVVNILVSDDVVNINNKETVHNNSVDSNPDNHFDNLSTQNNISSDVYDISENKEISNRIPCFTNSSEQNENDLMKQNDLPIKSVDENDVSTPTIHYGKHIIMSGQNSYDKQEYD
jgi:hypothetical protein